MKTLSLCLLFLFQAESAISAQTIYAEGFIITSSHDTIYGEIADKGYFLNSKSCEYKPNGTDSIINYLPGEIAGYGFNNGKLYVSKDIDAGDEHDLLFLEYLFDGRLDIYFSQDESKENHFYASNDSLPLRELKYEENIRKIDGRNVRYKSKHHEYLLRAYTSDCPELQEDISNLGAPTHKNLIALAGKYHSYTSSKSGGSNPIIYSKKTSKKMYLNLAGGPFIFFPPYNDEFPGLRASTGFNLMFQLPSMNESLFIGLGLYAEGFNGSSDHSIRLPLSFSLIKPNQGFSPVFSYELDLLRILYQSFKFGVKYQINQLSFCLLADLKTALIKPYGGSIQFSILLNLRDS